MFEISSGLQKEIALTLISKLNGSVLKIYGDPASQAAADALIPVDAHSALGTATLLCTVSVDGIAGAGGVVHFDPTPLDGVIYKEPTEAWLGTNAASGYASFYRLVKTTDSEAASATDIRVQGNVGVMNKDLIVASAYLTSGQEQRVDSFMIGVPKE